MNWWLKRVNYIDQFLILGSAISGCISVSTLASLIGIPAGITSSALKKKHNKIVLLAKAKLNIMEVLISKALIDSVISHDQSAWMNNVLKGYNKMKDKIKNQI